MNTSLWIAQIILAILLMMGAVMKFMPLQKIATKMPWMGEVSSMYVRLLGVLDLIAAAGLLLPMFLNIHPEFTFFAAVGTIGLMISAIIFHISRGEKKDIGFNIFVLLCAFFCSLGKILI
jgi:hypothetical protein